MLKLLRELEKIIGREDTSSPRPEDYKNKADYIFAKTISKRFPKKLNDPCKSIEPLPEELVVLWGWANGEKGIGKIKPEYKFLALDESKNIREDLYLDSMVSWLNDLFPIFSAPNNHYVCLKEKGRSIFSVNLTDGEIFLIAASIEDYFRFLVESRINGAYDNGRIHSSDPVAYTKIEMDTASKVGLGNYYPSTKDHTTIFSNLLDEEFEK